MIPSHARPCPAAARAGGFTLVELVIVILILGVLAAVALPRLFDFGRDARVAKVEGMRGAVEAATKQARGAYLLRGNRSQVQERFRVEGVWVFYARGYPEGGNCCDIITGASGPPAGIEALINHTGYTLVRPDTARTRFEVPGAPTPATCSVTYVEAPNWTTPATVSMSTAGC